MLRYADYIHILYIPSELNTIRTIFAYRKKFCKLLQAKAKRQKVTAFLNTCLCSQTRDTLHKVGDVHVKNVRISSLLNFIAFVVESKL